MTPSSDLPGFTGYQKFMIAVLAFLQFTIILDFMILSPLGAILMPELKITPSQFGMVVSAYAFSAGASGILAAGFADRFDRKALLMFFYSGFILGTFLCGIATDYKFLMVARIVTGLFGGVIGSIILAITTDLFPFQKRGRVMGFIQTSFAASQVMGIPIGLYLSNHWGWHAPFMMIVGVSIAVGMIISLFMNPIRGHLKGGTDKNPFHHLWKTVTNPFYLQAFATTALLSTGGFMLMPFSSAFSVHNLLISLHELPMVYMVTGICAMIAGPLIGRASDKFGKFNVFVIGSSLSAVMVLIYTNLPASHLYVVMGVMALLFIGVSSRMIASQALMSAIPTPANRGAFMSVSASVQQVSGGIAAVIAGLIVSTNPDGSLVHFDMLGYVVLGATLITMTMMYFIHKKIPEQTKPVIPDILPAESV